MSEPFPQVEALVPHRGRMLLIDAVEAFTDGTVVCKATVRSDNPFLEAGILPGHALIEYMAQTTACHAGLAGLESSAPGPAVGFLVGARGVELSDRTIRQGDDLVIEVRQEGSSAEFGSYSGSVNAAGQRVCSGRLSIYHPAGRGEER